MHIFSNEDRSYLSWITHHRHGFVLDMLKRPTRKHPVIHRATCDDIRTSKTKKTHWTTGRHLKACSLDIEELGDWANTQWEIEPVYCEQCRPTDEEASQTTPQERHLTKLGRDILDYVVEAAVISLDQGVEYDTSVSDVAKCLDKTPAQITLALLRLVEDGFLRIEGPLDANESVPSDRQVFPTVDAMRTLPAFHEIPARKVEAELEHLTEDED